MHVLVGFQSISIIQKKIARKTGRKDLHEKQKLHVLVGFQSISIIQKKIARKTGRKDLHEKQKKITTKNREKN